jgi:gag-polypeptide of LTR copia-type
MGLACQNYSESERTFGHGTDSEDCSTRTQGAGSNVSGADGAVGGQVVGTDDTATRMGKAVAIIILSLGDTPLRAVDGENEDLREMWTRLHARYARTSSSTKVTLHEKVANKNLKRRGNVVNHIPELEQLYDMLKKMGDNVTQGQRVATFLRNLGPEYDAAVSALRSIPDELL